MRILSLHPSKALRVLFLFFTTLPFLGHISVAQTDPIIGIAKISSNSGGLGMNLPSGSSFARACTGLGDVDGDGVPDMAVGLNSNDGGIERGAVFVIFLNRNGSVKNYQAISSTQGQFPNVLDDYDGLGGRLAALGDLNNDGVPDLAVSAMGDDDGATDKGAIYILFLDRQGRVASYSKISGTQGGFTGTFDADDAFPSSLAAIGDLDQDGVTELFAGAYQEDTGGGDRGAGWILFLRADGTVRTFQKVAYNVGGLINYPNTNSSEFGIGATPIGDLDGDGVNDLVVSSRLEDSWGAIQVLLLNANGTVKSRTKIGKNGAGGLQTTMANFSGFGFAPAMLGTRSGKQELLAGIRLHDDGALDAGAAIVLKLNSNGTVASEQFISQNTGHGSIALGLGAGDQFGFSAACVGDVDGNGSADMAVGAPKADDGATDAGAVRVLFTPALPSEAYAHCLVNNITVRDGINGGVSLVPYGTTGTITYSWTGTNATGASASGLSVGTYGVNVLQNGSSIRQLSVGVGYDIDWRTLDHMDKAASAIKHDATTGWAYARSSNQLPSGTIGWLEWTIDKVQAHRAIGFAGLSYQGTGHQRVENGFLLQTDGRLFAIAGTVLTYVGRYVEGDLLRIEKSGGDLLYIRNSTTLQTVAVGTDKHRAAVAAIYSRNGNFSDMRASFGPGLTAALSQQNVSINEPTKGSIAVNTIWGQAPFTYLWNDGRTTSTIIGLSQGPYSVMVKDVTGDSLRLNAFIQTDVTFATIEGAKQDDNTLVKVDSTGWNNAFATSENMIAAGDTGWIQLRITDPNMVFAFALKDRATNVRYGVKVEGGMLYSYFEGGKETASAVFGQVGEKLNVKAGDVLRIQRTLVGNSSTILFVQNDRPFLIYQEANAQRDLLVELELKSADAKLEKVEGFFTSSLSSNDDCVLTHFNYVKTTTFFEDGSISGVSKTYLDRLGRPLQQQTKDLNANNVLVSQTVYDALGRSALQTLPAPKFQSSVDCYRLKFIANSANTAYGINDFDQPDEGGVLGERKNPAPVNANVKGTLGWYYSNNNTAEPYVAASAYPYVRTIFQNDPKGQMLFTHAPGEKLRAGSGHGTKQFSMVGADALARVSNSTQWSTVQVYKTITVDADGLEVITYSNDQGQMLGTCRSGMAPDCPLQQFRVAIETEGAKYLDVHVPASQKQANGTYSSLRLVRRINSCFSPPSAIKFTLMDVEKGKTLEENVDYVILGDDQPTLSGYVQFLGAYVTGPSYLRIAYTLNFANPNADPATPNSAYDLWHLPDQEVWFSLDYGYWSLRSYDPQGNLRAVTPPEGVDCSKTINFATSSTSEAVSSFGACSQNGSELIPHSIDDHIGQVVFSYKEQMNANQPITVPTGQNMTLDVNVGIWASDIIEPADPESQDDYLQTYDDHMPNGNPCGYIVHSNTPPSFHASGWDQFAAQLSAAGGGPDIVRTDRLIPFQTGNAGSGLRIGEIPVAIGDPWGDYCETSDHCSDLTQNCGESSVDISWDCPLPPCYGFAPQRHATYRFNLEVFVVDANGNETSKGTLNYQKTLWRTCDCKYKWTLPQVAWSAGHAILVPGEFDNDLQHIGLTPAEMANTADLVIRLTSVKVDVQNDPNDDFGNYVASNYDHDLARFLGFQAFSTAHVIPVQAAPPVHRMQMTYAYSALKQLITSNDPDRGITELVYDQRGRLRFSQNAEQRITDNQGYQRFSFVDMDRSGRTLRSGVYKYNPTSNLHVRFEHMANDLITDQGVLTTMSPDVLDAFYAFPVNQCEEVTSVFYDVPDGSYPEASFATGAQHLLPGRVSRTGNAETTTWYSYDVRGRLVWTAHFVVQLNKYYTMHYTYDTKGQLASTTYQRGNLAERFDHWFQYDANGRLKRVLTGTDGVLANAVERAEYKHYLHGPLKRTELGGNLQGMDYLYTIQGWLKAINAPDKNANDPGKDAIVDGPNAGFAEDLFGMALDYFSGDYLRNGSNVRDNVGFGHAQVAPDRFTGLVKTQRWNNRALADPTLRFAATPLMYAYKYDDLGQLTEANLATYNPASNQAQGMDQADVTCTFRSDYRTWGISYDKNGNIRTLNRNGNGAVQLSMDQLTYAYTLDQNGRLVNNRLGAATDAVTTSPYAGLDLSAGQATNNYTYGPQGQLANDVIGGKYYTYYATGLVKAVYSDAQRTQLKAKFTYDDRGKRLLKESYANGNTVTERAWYLNDAAGSLVAQVRADGNGNTQRTEHPVTGAQRIGFYDRSGAGSMRYELTDHLGNVRVGLVVTNGQVIVAEAHDYYPHGMPMPGRNITSPAAGAYAYQGKENMTATGMLDFDLRDYDAQLGRWVVCDPMMQHFSPYLAMGNNPVMGVDPTGGYSIQSVDGDWVEVGYEEYGQYTDARNQNRADRYFDSLEQDPNSGARSDQGVGGSFSYLKEEHSESWVDFDQRRQGIRKYYTTHTFNPGGNEQGQSDQQTWYYMFRKEGKGAHAMVYNPATSYIYEVNSPKDKNGHEQNGAVGVGFWAVAKTLETLTDYDVPSGKSVGYRWSTKQPQDMRDFWKREKGSVYYMMPVTVSNSQATEAWFESYVGNWWDFNMLLDNCADFALRGLRIGGGVMVDCLNPGSTPGTYTMTFTESGMNVLSPPYIVP